MLPVLEQLERNAYLVQATIFLTQLQHSVKLIVLMDITKIIQHKAALFVQKIAQSAQMN